MKKSIFIAFISCIFLAIGACKNEKSLQKYIIDSSEKKAFMYGDIPVGLMLTPKEEASEEVKKTIKSIRKINAVFYKKTTKNDIEYETEKLKLKNIFNKKEYKIIGSLKSKGMNMKLYYTGETDKINEIIAFGYNEKIGVGVARLLGEKMNPVKIIEMMNAIKVDTSMIDINNLKPFFGK